MTELAAVCFMLVLAVLGMGLLWFFDRKAVERARAAEAGEWRAERRELLTRIQRPDLVPIPKSQTRTGPPRRAHDEIHKVGVVSPLRPGGDDNDGDQGGEGA